MTEDQITKLSARAAHEVTCLRYRAFGVPVLGWEDAEMTDALRAEIIEGARLTLAGSSPEVVHTAWWKRRVDAGWVFGPVKSFEAKTHPGLIPYDQLPEFNKQERVLFQAVVRATAASLR